MGVPSAFGTTLANVRKVFNVVLDKAGLHRRGPHQMRHTLGSLLVNAGEPITYVSRQMGNKDSAITLPVNVRWLPDGRKGVDSLDSATVARTLQRPTSVTLRNIA
jgi:integrase